MATDPCLLAKARRKLAKEADANRKRRAVWREQLYADQPRLREVENEIRRIFLNAMTGPSPGVMAQAAEQSLALQQERESILIRMGASADSLEERPLCHICGDTGYAGHELCECLLEKCRAIQAAELSGLLDLQGQTFDTFNAELFSTVKSPAQSQSPRQNIEVIYETCVEFCRKFEKLPHNLLFSGPPGTGKTFLSACVAGALSESGYSVVYDTAVHQLAQMEAVQFGRGNEEAERAVQQQRQCDLLIIDDLGMEFITPFAQSALWDLVNTRLISGKKMLISTNLNSEGIRARYSSALASRLEGEFLRLDFFGDDLRQRER